MAWPAIEVIKGVHLVEADLADAAVVDELLAAGPWHAVFHFAAISQVGESMRLPFRYLLDNGLNGIQLIEACVRHGISRFPFVVEEALEFGAAGFERSAGALCRGLANDCRDQDREKDGQ